MGLSPIRPVALQKGEIWTETHAQGGHMSMKAKGGGGGSPERATDPQYLGEAHPPDTLLPDFQPLELGDHAFLLFKPPVHDTLFFFGGRVG